MHTSKLTQGSQCRIKHADLSSYKTLTKWNILQSCRWRLLLNLRKEQHGLEQDSQWASQSRSSQRLDWNGFSVCTLSKIRNEAAYLLLAGNANTEKILSSVGTGANSTRVNKVVNELKVKSVEELIASCREMPSGGAAPTAAAEEKEEKKKEVSEPRSMTTWASVSLGALAFLPPKTAERHCVVQSFWKCANYLSAIK
ncbi:hypothetical protein pipiens_016045 [Culex pipiens pipiens]|uniref:Uncharacterized protein n=1 Tax=Culex pipiens pipiens TaxID=38569 RepID=A0ABD1CMY6_CULPP